MSDLLFVIKALVATVALVVVMQIKIGHRTVEQHSLAWIHQSVIVEQLQEVAAGAVKIGRKSVGAISNALGIKTSQVARTEQEILGLKIKRSEAYWKQRERELEEARDEEIERIGAEAISTKAEIN